MTEDQSESDGAETGERDGAEADGQSVITVEGTTVRGVDVDAETRCTHYDSAVDVVALAFPCCEPFYPCFECHETVADHDAERWPQAAFDREAVLCGRCGTRLSIASYLECEDVCPACGADFNPGCRNHYPQYFVVDEAQPEESESGAQE